MKYRIEAMAEPEWDESIEGNLELEQEWMEHAERDLMRKAGIPRVDDIKFGAWEVGGWDDAEWTIECDEEQAQALRDADWLFMDE